MSEEELTSFDKNDWRGKERATSISKEVKSLCLGSENLSTREPRLHLDKRSHATLPKTA